MILSCGDTLIDMVPKELHTGETAFLPVCGGALFNTAICLGRLGQRVGLLTGVSTDMFGEQLMQALLHSHVDTTYCIRSHRPTTTAFVKLVDGNARYHFVDENSAQRMLNIHHIPALSDAVSTLHFGCLSLVAEPCGQFFETLMVQYADTKVISCDPNIRPGFITDACAYRKRLQRFFAHSDIIKLSDEDFDWLSTGQSFTDFAGDCIANGTALVVLTQGDTPVEVVAKNTAFSVPVPPVAVVDTIGAGDTFNAGLLASLCEQHILSKQGLQSASKAQLQQAVQLGIKVARYTVQQTGANPPWASDL